MRDILNAKLGRRGVLGAGLAGASMLAMPSVLRAQDKSLKVGVYGGFFKDRSTRIFSRTSPRRPASPSNPLPSRPAKPGLCSSNRLPKRGPLRPTSR